MKNHRCYALLAILALLAPASIAFAAGPGVDQNNPDLPPAGVYLTPSDVHAMYNGPGLAIVLTAVQHQPFANGGSVGQGPTRTAVNGGNDLQEDFQSSITGMVSINGGAAIPVSGTGPVQVISFGNGPLGATTGTFNTEMTAMSLDLGGGVLIRESPTLQSLGQTTITPIGGGNFHIDSFFDVFTELSLTGGATWIPADGAAHVDLYPIPEPTSMMLLALGLVGLLGYARRRRAA